MSGDSFGTFLRVVNQSEPRNTIFLWVSEERNRQDRLHPEAMAGKSLAILAEEFGEVGKAIFEDNREELREELVHVAAVAVRWLEELDKQDKV